jgi:uncharacterized membrane protein SirB2
VASYYILIKSVHVWSVTLSIALFLLRGGLMLADSPWLRNGVLRWSPHVVDTVLLTSALMLTGIVHQYPFANGWLTAKVIGLVAYVVLGSVALRRGSTRRVRVAALVGALATVAYIVATALRHDWNPLHW